MAVINISTWRSLKLADPNQQQIFIDQLVQYLTNQFGNTSSSTNTLNNQVATLNGQVTTLNNEITAANPLSILVSDLGTLASNPTQSCSGYGRVFLSMAQGGANRTLTLTNLATGTDVRIYVRTNSTFNFKVIASDPSSVAYTVFSYWANLSADPKVNMTTTGWSGYAGFDLYLAGHAASQGGTNYLPLLTLSG